jgi:hypothetical protein
MPVQIVSCNEENSLSTPGDIPVRVDNGKLRIPWRIFLYISHLDLGITDAESLLHHLKTEPARLAKQLCWTEKQVLEAAKKLEVVLSESFPNAAPWQDPHPRVHYSKPPPKLE